MHEQVAAITPLRRLGMPEDIAGVVVFLASSLADYLTGEYIPVTGGSFMI
jgi:3-oxoacyl-[acyl-carrier protein] reductase